MRAIERVTTAAVILLTLTQSAGGQTPPAAFADQMARGDQAMQRRQYDQAVEAYKKAFSLSNKSSFDAAAAMVLAYRAMGDHKSALDRAGDALKLAGQDAHLQAQGHNLRGSALYALSEKPDDKRIREAETEFRTALAAQEDFHPARFNLGTALLKQGRDEDGIRELKLYVEELPTGGDAARAKQMIEDPRRARETFAPAFSFTATRGGEHVALDDFKGRTILVDVWGSWCGPCKMSTPAIVRLHKKYTEQGVVFLGIAKDREKDFNGYIDSHHLDWPQLLDTSNAVLHQFGITGYPTFIIIDGEGIIRARRMGWGADTESWLESEIKKSLKKGQ